MWCGPLYGPMVTDIRLVQRVGGKERAVNVPAHPTWRIANIETARQTKTISSIIRKGTV